MKKTILAIFLFVLPVCAFAQSVLDNTQVRLFSHAEYSAIAKDTSNKFNHHIEIGDIELLITSQITDRLSVLAEIIHTPDAGVELDRMMIKYEINDYFHLSAGKLYSPLGFWNTTFYHHARVLSPTIDHPVVIADASDFGVLNNKNTGIQIGGENISKLRFGYRVIVGNGLSDLFGNTQRLQNVGYNFFVEPVDNLKFGVSGQFESMKAGSFTSAGQLQEGATFSTLNASVMYMGRNKFEFASEFYQNQSSSSATGSKNFNAFFAYAGYKLKKVTPYFMYNKTSYDAGQQVYLKNNFTGSTIGLRYSISPLAILKLEAQFMEADEFQKLNRIEMMWAVGF